MTTSTSYTEGIYYRRGSDRRMRSLVFLLIVASIGWLCWCCRNSVPCQPDSALDTVRAVGIEYEDAFHGYDCRYGNAREVSNLP